MKSKETTQSKNIILLIIGQIISLFGNQILRFALPLYLLNQTGSSALFGTISAVSFIPMILLFPIGGAIADRFNKRNIMVILDFSTSVLIILFSILMHSFSIVVLIAIMLILLFAIQGAYQPAVKASIPLLVSREHLMRANSVVDVVNSLSAMLGPVIGGLLLAVFSLTPILYISAVCFFASAVMEIFIYIPFERREIQGDIIKVGFHDIAGSFRFIFKKETIVWKMSIVYGLFTMLLTSLFVIALPVLLTQRLGFSMDTANRLYGYAQGAIAVGSIIGGILVGVLSKKLKPTYMPYMMVAAALCTLLSGIVLQAVNSSMAIYIVLALGCSILMIISSTLQIQMMSYIQMMTPVEMIGKVTSAVICVCMCSVPIGQLLFGIAFEHIENSVYILFYLAAVIVIVISILTRSLYSSVSRRVV